MGLGGAVVTGLGAILGTGAYVSIGIAAGQWGDAVLYALPIAGLVALFSGLSSAYLAGQYPVAGGTYEYAYRTLGPGIGFLAGWLFLVAKTASAAAAALGIATYLGFTEGRVIAIASTVIVTAFVAAGLRRTTWLNVALVLVTLTGLLAFIMAAFRPSLPGLAAPDADPANVLPSVAFLFVAFTGYGRIATLGEEVTAPSKTIPRAVVVTLAVVACIYMGVALAGRALFGANWGLALETGTNIADLLDQPLSMVVAIGALTAMTGVLLNLVLGLYRVWLAMGRRGDMPAALAKLGKNGEPISALFLSGGLVAVVCLVGEIGVVWSFSAFTVLLYYGVTNLSALRLDRDRATAWIGLISCLLLAFFIPLLIWLVGTTLLAVGVLWKRQRTA
jgi:APA family basic amino acid/polyamine antiporter